MNTSTLRSFIAQSALVSGLFCSAHAADPAYWAWAQTPPMGWNSWDSFGAGVWQTNALANADYMAKNLESHGWNLITIDIQWYEPLAHTTAYRRGAVLETENIPIAGDAQRLAEKLADGSTALDHALGDGEDFELILAVPPEEAHRLVAEQLLAVPLTDVGYFVAEPGLWQADARGQRRPLRPRGYEH